MENVCRIQKKVVYLQQQTTHTMENKVYRIQIKNFGSVAWRMYDKVEYSETDANTMVARLNQDDEVHYYRKVRIR